MRQWRLDPIPSASANKASREWLTLIRIFEELRRLGYAGGTMPPAALSAGGRDRARARAQREAQSVCRPATRQRQRKDFAVSEAGRSAWRTINSRFKARRADTRQVHRPKSLREFAAPLSRKARCIPSAAALAPQS